MKNAFEFILSAVLGSIVSFAHLALLPHNSNGLLEMQDIAWTGLIWLCVTAFMFHIYVQMKHHNEDLRYLFQVDDYRLVQIALHERAKQVSVAFAANIVVQGMDDAEVDGVSDTLAKDWSNESKRVECAKKEFWRAHNYLQTIGDCYKYIPKWKIAQFAANDPRQNPWPTYLDSTSTPKSGVATESI